MPELELQELKKRYGATVALDGISFRVDEGITFGFVGPNGAGKTTAMRIILGVLAADTGWVGWGGSSINSSMRRQIGYMPEERGLYPKMRVGDQLAYMGRLHGMGEADAVASAQRWMKRLGIAGRSEDAVEQLSLGNQQRVQLAAALVHSPALLVLDEPFSGLDPIGVDVLSDVLAEEVRERGVPVIFSSHQLELVERICDAVAIIDSGRLIATGTVDDLRASAGADRWRIEVDARTDDWWSQVRGAHRISDGLFELDPGTSPDRLLDAARVAGSVSRFGRELPGLAEMFREIVSDSGDEREATEAGVAA